jgi:hypothetical protein
MPANDREVFQYLGSDPETPGEIDQLTYAIFANERQHWCELFQKQNDREPTQQEIDHWVSEITDWRFGQMRGEAIQFFDAAAREYLAEEMEALKKEIFNDTVVKEVKAASGFWRQLAMQLITAIAAPVLIGLIIAAALLYDRSNPTISTISDRIQPPKATGPSPPAN